MDYRALFCALADLREWSGRG